LRRIEIGGGVLSEGDKAWLATELVSAPDLAMMCRVDEGFPGTPEATIVQPKPDARYDSLSGEERLSALETAIGTARRGWNDDPSARAWDWMCQPGNAAKLIADLEMSANAGVYRKLWEQFGWAHSPLNDENDKPPAEKESNVNRVLALLALLPESVARVAIEGLTNWLSSWQSFVVTAHDGLVVWSKIWPLAVAATDSAQRDDRPVDLNLVASSTDDREPMDLDTLNTPAGRLVSVFLAACPKVDGSKNPFAEPGVARTMRETVIAATGRSGLIVRHRLIEYLPYFLLADADWTRQHLIEALVDDDGDAVSLWRALARRTQFYDVLKIIGPAVVMRASDLRLGRETRRLLVFSLVVECLHALNEGREPAVPYAAIQQMLRAIDDELRARAAGAIQQFIREVSAPRNAKAPGLPAEELFERAAAPFLRDVWPQEHSLATPGVSKALADLPATVPVAFVAAVNAIERFLVPFDAWSMLEYGLFGKENGESKLSSIDSPEKATALLRLLDLTIGTVASAVVPYDLAAALARIETISPQLSQNPKFRRLAAAARR
jgi:hypothetical protein